MDGGLEARTLRAGTPLACGELQGDALQCLYDVKDVLSTDWGIVPSVFVFVDTKVARDKLELKQTTFRGNIQLGCRKHHDFPPNLYMLLGRV